MSHINTELFTAHSKFMTEARTRTKASIMAFLGRWFYAHAIHDYGSFNILHSSIKRQLIDRGLCPSYLHELIPSITFEEARQLLNPHRGTNLGDSADFGSNITIDMVKSCRVT